MSQAMIVDINLGNVQEMVLQNSKRLPVALVFWSAKNEQSRLIVTILEKLAKEMSGEFILGKVNVDLEPKIVEQLGNPQAPFFKLIKNGDIAVDQAGLQTEQFYRDTLKQNQEKDPSEELRDLAKEAFHQGNLDQAIQLLGEAAKANANNYKIHLDLVQMYIQTGHIEKARDLFVKLPEQAQQDPLGKELDGFIFFSALIEDAPDLTDIQQTLTENPDDCHTLLVFSGILMLNGQAENALQTLIKLFMVDRSYGEGIAQKAILKGFEMLTAKAPELVTMYRRKFQNLLY